MLDHIVYSSWNFVIPKSIQNILVIIETKFVYDNEVSLDTCTRLICTNWSVSICIPTLYVEMDILIKHWLKPVLEGSPIGSGRISGSSLGYHKSN